MPVSNQQKIRLAAGLILALIAILVLAACGAAGGNESDPVGAVGNVQNVSAANNNSEQINDNRAGWAAATLDVLPGTLTEDRLGIQVGFTKDGHAFRGNPNAPIVIQEFSDFQCPFCARFIAQTMPDLDENQIANGEAVLVFYDFPLTSIHPQAVAAAVAARCAGDQGAVYFWEMHDLIFANTQAWSTNKPNQQFRLFAQEMNLDEERFNSCLTSERFNQSIEDDLALGSENSITGTPSFLINGQLLVGAQPLAAFNNAIDTIQQGGQLASNEPAQPSQPAAAPTPAALSDDFAAAMGDPDAPITIVEFTDYECPYCSRHSLETMPQIVSEMVNSGQVYYILKDFPLDQLHPNARAGAAAARCGGEQGAYREMHDLIFANQSEWAGANKTNEIFGSYAATLNLDEALYAECLASGRYDAAVEANLQEGESLGVSGTPFFFIDGYPLNGARPFEHFQVAVQLAEEGRLAEALAPPQQAQQPTQPQQPSGPQDVPIGDAYVLGDPNAPITIIEYTDFQCPFCSRHFQQTYPQIVSEYVEAGLVRYVFKDFPLNSIHPQAAKAAEAARCAGDQEAYLGMHELLFNGQQQWSINNPTPVFAGYSEQLGLDTEQFTECLDSDKYEAAVNADLQEGISFGITGTPAFFINGYPVSGAQPYGVFQQALTQLLAELES